MQTAQSVFPLPATQPFAMDQATSTPTPSSPTRANPSTRVMSAELLATMYSGSQPMAPPLLGRPSRIPQEGFLPEFRVDVAETAEIDRSPAKRGESPPLGPCSGGFRQAQGESIPRDLPRRSLIHSMAAPASPTQRQSGTTGLHQVQSSNECSGKYTSPASTDPDTGLCEPCGAGSSPAALSEADGRKVRQSATAADQAVLDNSVAGCGV